MNHHNAILDIKSRIVKTRVLEPTPVATDEDLKNFDRIEKFIATDPVEVPVTPLLANGIRSEFKSDEYRLKLDAPICETEKEIFHIMFDIGLKHHGEPVLDYSSVDEERYSDVDFGRNFIRMGREVSPGTFKRRLINVDKYKDASNKPFDVDVDVLNNAVETIIQEYGYAKISHLESGPRGRVPFQSYHTNVGYPGFRNDRASINGKKYEEIAFEAAKKLELKAIPNLPAGLAGRDQRSMLPSFPKSHGEIDRITHFEPSKARVVYMTSRLGNIGVAKIKTPTIDYVKLGGGMFSGYNDDVTLATIMYDCMMLASDLGLKQMNLDFSAFDTSISPDLLAVGCYIQQAGCSTEMGKELTLIGTIGNAKMCLGYNVAGERLKLYKNGAISSGYIGTNLDGGTINSFIISYALIKILGIDEFNKRVGRFRQNRLPGIMVMGDDVLINILDDYEQANLIKTVIEQSFGMEVNPLKGEGGCFFLQKRVDRKTKRGEGLTPSPRSVSKSFGIERPKGLGPYGWVMATWMKLMNSRYTPEIYDVVRCVANYDRTKLGLLNPDGSSATVQQFLSGLSAESTSIGESTKERLSDGDPNEAYIWDGGKPSSTGVNTCWTLIKEGITNGNFDYKSRFAVHDSIQAVQPTVDSTFQG